MTMPIIKKYMDRKESQGENEIILLKVLRALYVRRPTKPS